MVPQRAAPNPAGDWSFNLVFLAALPGIFATPKTLAARDGILDADWIPHG
jgi:hypothetical protein